MGYGLGVALTDLDLVVLLNERAAWAPIRHAAVVESAACDVIALSDLGSLQHAVDPSATSEAVY